MNANGASQNRNVSQWVRIPLTMSSPLVRPVPTVEGDAPSSKGVQSISHPWNVHSSQSPVQQSAQTSIQFLQPIPASALKSPPKHACTTQIVSHAHPP